MFGSIKFYFYLCSVIQLSIYLTGTDDTKKRLHSGVIFTT